MSPFLKINPFIPAVLFRGKTLSEDLHWDPSTTLPLSVPSEKKSLPLSLPDMENGGVELESSGPIEGKDAHNQKEVIVYSRRSRLLHYYQSSNPKQIPKEATCMENLEQNDLNVPIALQKGVRTCTQHPITNYVHYERPTDQYRDSTAKNHGIAIPRDIKSALQILEWKVVVLEEMKALTDSKTWDIVRLAKRKKIVGSKRDFLVKYRSDEGIERYKARLVAQGYT